MSQPVSLHVPANVSLLFISVLLQLPTFPRCIVFHYDLKQSSNLVKLTHKMLYKGKLILSARAAIIFLIGPINKISESSKK